MSVREALVHQRDSCAAVGSSLYAELLAGLLADFDDGGVVHELLAGRDERALHDAVPLRLLGGVHRLVLSGRAPRLAHHYPSVGGSPGHGLVADALAVANEHRGELLHALDEPVQTNEVGRAAALVGGFAEIARRTGLALRTLEVGASAGLLSWWDHYRYRCGEGLGPSDAAVVFESDSWDPAPDLSNPVTVVERRACDVAPIDVASDAGRIRLMSFVWPDQLHRFERLRTAIDTVAAQGFQVERASADEWVKLQLQLPVVGVATVVFHSIVLQYLGRERSAAFRAALGEAGERASAEAPLAWLRMEPAGPVADIRLTMWPGGHTDVLGVTGYHGPPVRWGAPGDPPTGGG